MNINIEWSVLRQQINLRNFYMGESAKRNNLDADTIQSCKDDDNLLLMFTQKACNELINAAAARFPSITAQADWDNISFTIKTESNPPSHFTPMLTQAITDYLVNEVNMHWMLTVKPEMAQTYISLRSGLYNNVQYIFSKLYNKNRPRRRPTDLAGI